MKKKQIANLVMVAIILVIAAAGVLTVGYLRGWFDKADQTVALLTEVKGNVNLLRDGVIFPVEGDTVLRGGDELICDPGAAAVIRVGEDYVAVGEKAALRIEDPAAVSFSVILTAGEAFANTRRSMTFRFDGKVVEVTDAVASFSIRTGTQSINVYEGQVENARAGQVLTYLPDETTVGELQIQSLNQFLISQVHTANESVTLCFTGADLDRLQADRNQAIQDLLNSQTKPTEPAQTESTEPPQTQPTETAPVETEPVQTRPEETRPAQTVPPATKPVQTEPPTTKPVATEPPATKPDQTEPPATRPAQTEPPTTEPAQTEPPETQAPATQPPATTKPVQSTEPEEPKEVYTCVITIRCDTILNNLDALEPGKLEFVPEDGVILYPVEVQFEEGDTVFDVLRYVCDTVGIPLEYSWTPLYGSYYVEGINNLYEFDCGYESGWMYKVNGWFPNYGCSSYTLSDGDVVEWLYTCQGLGTDVGAPEWEG